MSLGDALNRPGSGVVVLQNIEDILIRSPIWLQLPFGWTRSRRVIRSSNNPVASFFVSRLLARDESLEFFFLFCAQLLKLRPLSLRQHRFYLLV